MSRLLVLGARSGSLGDALMYAGRGDGLEVTTAGVTDDEMMQCDVTDVMQVEQVLAEVRPHHVVCTVGVNLPSPHTDPVWLHHMVASLQVNVVGVANVLQQWLHTEVDGLSTTYPGHFVAISSNSAHVARSRSAPYCASKAALSMLLRVVARERGAGDRLVYGYEPGLLATTQTAEVREMLGDVAMHRMPGVDSKGLEPEWLADLVVSNLLTGSGPGLNGTLMRLDGGEQ